MKRIRQFVTCMSALDVTDTGTETMKAYIKTKCRRVDGSYDTYQTHEVPVKVTSQPWKGRTTSGYGCAIPTDYMVFWNSRWQRVKVICYGNLGTAYVGKKYDPQVTVDINYD